MQRIVLLLAIILMAGCDSGSDSMGDQTDIIFLHHSTGNRVWLGNTNRYVYKVTKRGDVESYIRKHNRQNNTNYRITDRNFPSSSPYGWKNYPFDYYNIWVKNGGDEPYMEEPTLEILTREYDIIIFKHCYPGSNILEDTGSPDIDSEDKRLENYKLQYSALKDKMHEFPDNKFIVWTPAVHVKNNINVDQAERTRLFYTWIMEEWDEEGDNIFIWDFYQYQTEGELFFQEKYAASANDSHPSTEFGEKVAPKFAQFIIDVAEGSIP